MKTGLGLRLGLRLALMLLTGSAFAADPRPFEKGSWEVLRQQHAGRPTIVHFWGLTCSPCLVELPQWGKFAETAKGPDIVMVAADPVSAPAAALTANLAKAGLATVESWAFADPFTERLEYEIDQNWRGELPFSVLIGRDGSQRTILGAVDFGDLQAWTQQQAVQQQATLP